MKKTKREQMMEPAVDIEAEITNMDWTLKNTLQRRAILFGLKQYCDQLLKDGLKDRVEHLNLYIEELEEARKR